MSVPVLAFPKIPIPPIKTMIYLVYEKQYFFMNGCEQNQIIKLCMK